MIRNQIDVINKRAYPIAGIRFVWESGERNGRACEASRIWGNVRQGSSFWFFCGRLSCLPVHDLPFAFAF